MPENLEEKGRKTYEEDIRDIASIVGGLISAADYETLEALEAKLNAVFDQRGMRRTDDPRRITVDVMLELLSRKSEAPEAWKDELRQRQQGQDTDQPSSEIERDIETDAIDFLKRAKRERQPVGELMIRRGDTRSILENALGSFIERAGWRVKGQLRSSDGQPITTTFPEEMLDSLKSPADGDDTGKKG